MKDRIKARLKAKFSGVNLSQKRMDAIADKLTLPENAEDSEIDARLDELNCIFSFADLAKDDDRIRSLQTKKKTDNKSDESKDDDEPAQDPTGLEAILQKHLAPITQELNALKVGKTVDLRKSALDKVLEGAGEKFAGLTRKNFERMNFETDEDFQDYLNSVTEDAKEFTSIEKAQNLSGLGVPFAPASTSSAASVDADIKAWGEKSK